MRASAPGLSPRGEGAVIAGPPLPDTRSPAVDSSRRGRYLSGAAAQAGVETVTFHSILTADATIPVGPDEPAFFADLNLDQMVTAVVTGREQYDLAPFLYAPLHDVEAVTYRQGAVRDLENEDLREAVNAFSGAMNVMRRYLDHAARLRHRYHQDRWFRESVAVYCDAVATLAARLAAVPIASAAFSELRDHLAAYVASDPFDALDTEGRRLDDRLAAVRYAVHLKDGRVTVRRYEGGDDYSLEVEQTFAKFKEGDAGDYRVAHPPSSDLNHIEAYILELVARLYPDTFAALDDYRRRHESFIDERIARFDREVQLYLGYLDYIEPLRRTGLEFCYPTVSSPPGETRVVAGFDLVLAAKVSREGGTVVTNDVSLEGQERALVVTGPNQGGKTTFARMFGQLHYLAGLGYPVPGEVAHLPLPDRIVTHFERPEHLETLRSKLEDDLVRVHRLLDEATGESIVIMNEAFSSTTLADAVFLGTEIMKELLALGVTCVYVTFVDELASLSDATVSMVATVDPNDPARRTYRIVRKPAEGLAYAAAIARKYGLSYEQLRERIGS